MGTYTFTAASLIREVSVVGHHKKPWAVYLFANENATPEQIEATRNLLQNKGCHLLAVSVEGKPALQLSKFSGKEDILRLLRTEELVEGKGEYTPSAEEEKKNKQSGFKRVTEYIREKSLRFTGLFYFLGGLGLAISGWLSGRKKEIFSGLLYSTTDPLLMIYGHPSVNQQLKRATERTIHYLNAQGIDIPDDSQLGHAARHLKTGTLHSLNNFFSDNPSQIACAVNGLAAAQLFRSGKDTLNTPAEIIDHIDELRQQKLDYDPVNKPYVYVKSLETGKPVTLTKTPMEHATAGVKQLFTDRGEATKSFSAMKDLFRTRTDELGRKIYSEYPAQLYDMVGGFANASAAFASLIIPEKKDSPEKGAEEKKHKKHSVGGLWDWIREKPLRLVGYVYSVVTLAYFKAGYDELRREKSKTAREPNRIKNYGPYGKLSTGALYLTADLLLAISSKDTEHRGSIGTEGARDMAARIAEVIVAQPKEKQDELINRIGGYLASVPEIHKSAEEMVSLIREQTQAITKNPWSTKFQAEQAPAKVTAPTQKEAPPVQEHAMRKQWQTRLEAEPASASQLGPL